MPISVRDTTNLPERTSSMPRNTRNSRKTPINKDEFNGRRTRQRPFNKNRVQQLQERHQNIFNNIPQIFVPILEAALFPGVQLHRSHYPAFRRAILNTFNHEIGAPWIRLEDSAPPPGVSILLQQVLPVKCENRRTMNQIHQLIPPIGKQDFAFMPFSTPIGPQCRNTNAFVTPTNGLHFVQCQGHRMDLDPFHGKNFWICNECADHEHAQWDFFRFTNSYFIEHCPDCCEHFARSGKKLRPCRCRGKLAPSIGRPTRKSPGYRPVKYYLCRSCRGKLYQRVSSECVAKFRALGGDNINRVYSGPRTQLFDWVYDDPNQLDTNQFDYQTRNHCPSVPGSACDGPGSDLRFDWTCHKSDRAHWERVMLRKCLHCDGEPDVATIHVPGWNNASSSLIYRSVWGRDGYDPDFWE